MSKKELLERIENNHQYHPPATPQREAAHAGVRIATSDCALALVSVCPESRELSLALTKIEEAMFWANAAIARVQTNER